MNEPLPRPGRSAAACALGLDIGGTKMAAALVGPDGTVLAKRVNATCAERGGEAVLRDAVQMADELAHHASGLGRSVVALGLGVCELVDHEGRIISNQTVKWRGLDVAAQFRHRAPAKIEADSRAAAFAEAWCGAGQAFGSFLYVTIGTGIGSSWVLNRVPYAGYTGCTGTLASSPISVPCPECGVTRKDVLEEYASGPGLVQRYNQRASKPAASAEAVLAAAEADDVHAECVINTAVEGLGSTIGLLINVLDPEAVVIGGGLGAAPGAFWERLPTAIRGCIWSDVHRGLPILQASCGGDSGVIGAALLAWKAVVGESALAKLAADQRMKSDKPAHLSPRIIP